MTLVCICSFFKLISLITVHNQFKNDTVLDVVCIYCTLVPVRISESVFYMSDEVKPVEHMENM